MSKPNNDFDQIPSNAIRIFISSTFADFQQERDTLARILLPEARGYASVKGIDDLIGVDLRWGITKTEAENGETLNLCLSEINRSQPYFIGLISERRGWIPSTVELSQVRNAPTWLQDMQGRSITEIELRQGLSQLTSTGTAFIFKRCDSKETQKADEYLKSVLSKLAHPNRVTITEYSNQEEFSKKAKNALKSLVNHYALMKRKHVSSSKWTAGSLHLDFARQRQTRFVGRKSDIDRLDRWFSELSPKPLFLISDSGMGKSSLVAYWAGKIKNDLLSTHVFEHYCAASPQSSSLIDVLERCDKWIAEQLGEPLPSTQPLEAYIALLPVRLEKLSAMLATQHTSALLLFDAVDTLGKYEDLRWLPNVFPDRISVLLTTKNKVGYSAATDRSWSVHRLSHLDKQSSHTMIIQELARYGKRISPVIREHIASHPKAGVPLFLKSLTGELQIVGSYESLGAEVELLTASNDVEELLDKIIARLSDDFGEDQIRSILCAIWVARAGLEDSHLIAICHCSQQDWLRVKHSLADLLQNRGGRHVLAHDQIRDAISRRFLKDRKQIIRARLAVAAHFEKNDDAIRWAEETPWQAMMSDNLAMLKKVFSQTDRFWALEQRGVVELISYWRQLVDNGCEPDKLLDTAVSKFFKDPSISTSNKANGAKAVTKFMRDAGIINATLLEVAQSAVDISIGSFGEESVETLQALSNLSVIQHQLGDVAQAEETAYRAFDGWRRLLGPSALETALTQLILAMIVSQRGDFSKAESLERAALKTRIQHLGNDHSLVIDALENLAVTLQFQKRFDESIEIQRQVLAARQRVDGKRHPSTSTALSNLAIGLSESGSPQQSLPLFIEARHARLEILGKNHPLTIRADNNLAITYRHLGDLGEAARLFEDVLKRRTHVLGAGHPDTEESQQNLKLIQQEIIKQ